MRVLVDTSVWIGYFREGQLETTLEHLLDNNTIVTNELILGELIPFLTVSGQRKLIRLLRCLPLQPLTIQWDEIVSLQVRCLRKGFSGIGLPDLILAQNAIQNKSPILTLDKHFQWIKQALPINLL